MKESFQADLFGIDPALVVIPKQAKLSPAQQKFQTLTATIEASKTQLAALQTLSQKLQSRAAGELIPIHQQLAETRTQLAQAVDRALCSGVKLGHAQRRFVVSWLCELCDLLLSEDEDLELVCEIFDRHSSVSWKAMSEEREQLLKSVTEDMMRNMFGDHMVDGHDADNAEDLMHFVQDRLDSCAQPKARKKTAKQQEKLAKREREAKEASQSVREMYRKLASAIHPDRESDTSLRTLRTEQMQRLNQAYESNDLLGLLSLQQELEGVAMQDAMNASEERLKVFIRVLDEQHKTLREEFNELLSVMQQAAGEDGLFLSTPAQFEAHFELTLRDIRQLLQMLQDDLQSAQDPTRVCYYMAEVAEAVKREKQYERRSAKRSNRPNAQQTRR